LTYRILWITLSFFIFSAAIFFIVPFFLINLPVNYFSERQYIRVRTNTKFPNYILLISLKNIFGIILLGIGIILLFIPGQGLLTIFTGLMLLNFPGKRRLELYIIKKKSVLNAINWLRGKYGKEKIVKIYGREK